MKRSASQNVLRLFVIMVMAIALITALATVGFAQENSNADKECYLTGDMNADGVFDNQDAYHALFSFMLPDKYSIDRDWDVNQDQEMDQDDAIALLYAYMLPELYSEYAHVYDMVHDYFDPAWNWSETADGVTATVTVQCACGEPHLLTEEEGVTVTKGQVKQPSCTQTGSESYTAMVTYEGETFVGSYSKVLPASGHIAGKSDYNLIEHYDLCENCGDKMNAASHAWKADGEPSAATCKVQAVQKYICDCGAEKQENLGYAEHDYVYMVGQDILVDDNCCQYAKQYKCSVCDEIETTDYYNKHNYIAVITEEANCQEAGTKTYKCTECPAVEKTESIPVDRDKHIWDNGTEQTGAIVYECTVEGCDATKKTVTATEDGTVSKDALVHADELKLGNDTSVSLGQAVKENLNVQDKVQIEVGEADKSLVEELLGDKKDQIEGITVYDFSMTVDDQPVTNFAEKITITMPYTLQPGEDADAISVWFIDDDGTLEEISATYSDGFVTFQTDHFSYYTVTRLTPEERCEKFGHIPTEVEQAATCTAEGYIKQVCQRCSHEEVTDVLQSKGHSYSETSRTYPTCEDFGITVEKCQNCQHEKYSVERALGHDMQQSNTKAATCTEAGYEEYTCRNKGCDSSYQVALAQLTHNYLADESKNVAASCNAGGYDVYVCEHCGDEVRRNETIALGHDYSVDSATWNEDKQNPAVTLRCSRSDCNATKELKANIFTKEASCLSGGIVEAIVSYNNKTFKKTLSTDPMLGHKAGKEWVVTNETHYLLCENCGQKMEVATHNYDEGEVTEAPTCVDGGRKVYTCRVCQNTKEEKLDPTGKHTYDEGVVTKEPTCVEQGVKTYTCGVCQKTITENIEATGEHSYEGGVCVSCGKEQMMCSHDNMTGVAVDLSKFGVCDGTELYLLSCDCGLVQQLEFVKIGCDFEETSNNQQYSQKTSATCAKCGLYAELEQGYIFTAEPCVALAKESGKVAIGGQTIVEYSYTWDGIIAEHPAVEIEKEVEVEHEGFCGMTLIYTKCPCGEVHNTSTRENCQWTYYGDSCICRTCGTVREEDVERVKGENCLTTTKYIYNYYNRDGELICSHDSTYVRTTHNQKVNQYELYGDSCEDGIKIWMVCVDCGEEEFSYQEGNHPKIFITETDLTDANICASSHTQSVCACGREAVESLNGDACEWNWCGYNEITREEINECRNCHAILTTYFEKGVKNEKCEYINKNFYTYTDANGNEILVGYDFNEYDSHNYENTWELKGESCEDGVLINRRCVDCGDSYQYTSEEHEYVSYQEYDLSKYGMCGGYLTVESCACGQDARSEIGTKCHWVHLGNDVLMCGECGTEWETSYTEKPLTQCETKMIEHNVLSYDDEVLLTFQSVNIMVGHRWDYEFELVGTSCEEGYFCSQTCQTCGQVREWGGMDDDHTTYPVDRELITDTGLCGDVEIVTGQCPCGKKTSTSISWVGEACQFEHVGYSKDGLTWIYVCQVCGAERHRAYTEEAVEGNSCLVEVRYEDTYYVEGEEVFRTSNSNQRVSHDWVTLYELMGKSCTDGVKISEKCSRCNTGSTYVTTEHCRTEQIVDLAEHGFCGGQLSVVSCPCGEESQFGIYYFDCEWNWVEDPKGNENSETYQCDRCGGIRTVVSTRGEDVDACHYEMNIVYTFTPADGESVEFVAKDVYTNHDWSETYELLGNLCTDGVRVERTCANCGTHDSNEYEYHKTVRVDEYNLSEYGMCDGVVRISRCCCGMDGAIKWDTTCNWEYVTGGKNFDVEQCQNCKVLCRHQTESGDKVSACETVTVVTYTFYTVENETENVLLSVSYNSLQSNHRYLYEFLLEEGETCMDHYMVYQSCADCSYTNYWGSRSDHMTYPVSRKDISKGQLCGRVDEVTVSCACGKVTGTKIDWVDDNCEFEYAGYDKELDCEKNVCRNCNAERYSITNTVPVEGTTCEYLVTERVVYSKNGEELFSENRTRTMMQHSVVAQLELLDKDKNCDSGYIFRNVCSKCHVITWEDKNVRYGCQRMRINQEVLISEDAGICGELYWDTYSCACGKEYQEQPCWGEKSCDWENFYDQETGEYLYRQCVVCGVREVTTNEKTYFENPVCKYLVDSTVSYLMGDQLVGSYQQQDIGYNHRWVYSYSDDNKNCEDGYTIGMKCFWCGKEETDTEIYYHHGLRPVEMEQIISDGDNVCGSVILEKCGCVCEEDSYYQVDYSCLFNVIEGQPNSYRCARCGLVYEDKSATVHKSGSCEIVKVTEYVYTTVDGDVGRVYKEKKSYEHILKYTFQGDCENGYRKTGTCIYCEKVIEQDEQLNYGHEQFRVAYYDLSSYGMCGGYIAKYSCACGADAYWGSNNNCEYENAGYKNEDGAWMYHCNRCNTDHGNMSTHDFHEEDCYADSTFYFIAIPDGEEPLRITDSYRRIEHKWILMDADGTCDGTYTAYLKCYFCKETKNEQYSNYHNNFLVDYVYLKNAGCCGGAIEKYSCVCGMEAYTNLSNVECAWTWKNDDIRYDEDGCRIGTSERTCDKCGLVISGQWHDEKTDKKCVYQRDVSYTVSMNGAVLGTYVEKGTATYHGKEVTTYTLVEGADSCEDGVFVERWCEICGSGDQWTMYGHDSQVTERYDLTEMGSVCGGSFVRYTCPCGYYDYAQFDSDCGCDMHSARTDCWVENAITGSQSTVDGNIYISSDAFKYTCAQTDPACGFTVRMAYCWLAEGCVADQYQIWQLGYDADTDTCTVEVRVPTGNRYTYHNYEKTEINDDGDGNDETSMYKVIHTCKDCQSTWVEETRYVNGNRMSYELTIINKLENFEERLHELREYTIVGYRGLLSKTVKELKKIDGTDEVRVDTYTYDLTDGCKTTHTWSVNGGEPQTETVEHYWSERYDSTSVFPTCTQPGVTEEWLNCNVCGQDRYLTERPWEPYGHAWQQKADGSGYYCDRCGLENSNGSDGTIVLEDMSAEYGNGENYVIGYWNRGEDIFEVNVSIVLKDGTEIQLDGINVTGMVNINAVAVNRNEVQTAAQNALGTMESYDVRVTFVPFDDSLVWDYAITLDGWTA